MKNLENKIPPPIVLLMSLILMRLLSEIGPNLDVDDGLRLSLTSLCIVLGLVCMLSGVFSFRKARTTVNPLKPETASGLVVGGIYRLSRNPMYLGMLLMTIGWAIFLSSPLSVLGILGFVLFINRFQIIPEENAMTKLFGNKYKDYTKVVRRWI